ncbi:MAG: DNA polymerase III subunit delta, partial [Rhodospirillales bacterium]|nr:DNA polymerase III subunit delta [Rhodospirillales bacterium]
YAAADGDAATLDRALERAFLEGESPVSVLRAVQRHLQRLHWTLGKVERGEPPQTAMKSLRPPLIFKFEPAFRTQLRQWRTDRLATALELATEAEIDCKSTGLPAAAVCHRALMRIAQAARAGARDR